ncbi:MAG: DoxX family protein [Bacteroidetes bacterium]|nr:DoxX family protein [Bacteroidota bacterium]MDA1121298.1 DoxX family protein [Bacteroidota bacterium]
MIKKLFQTDVYHQYLSSWMLLLRVLIAAFMLTHGFPKFLRLFGPEEINFGDPIGIGPIASFILVVFAEAFCSILIALGLGTRLATIPLIINLLVAGFIAHSADPFGRKELAFMYLLIYVTLLIIGAGKYSIDHLISKKWDSNR